MGPAFTAAQGGTRSQRSYKRDAGGRTSALFPFLRVPTAEGIVRDDGPDLWPRQGRKSLNLHGELATNRQKARCDSGPYPPDPPTVR